MTSITQGIPCLVCGDPLSVRPARGRKSGKPFVMMVCSRDGRHFRGFVTDQAYVGELLARMESLLSAGTSESELADSTTPEKRSNPDAELAR